MCTILHIAACNDWRTDQYDVKTAFLNGVLPQKEVQFMEQPPGFTAPSKGSHVWQLQRGLYGMRQSSRIWNKTMHTSFLKWGFNRTECEWCVYSRCAATGSTILAVHVDDMLATSSNDAEATLFCSELESTWQITALGEAKLVVGIAVRRDREMRTVMLSQTALINKIIVVFHQTDATPASTPMAHGMQLLPPDPRILLDQGEQD